MLAAAPPSVDVELRRAEEFVEAGAWDEAEALYARLVAVSADPGGISFNRGVVAAERGEMRQAELEFRRTLGDAAASKDRRARACYNLGVTLVQQAGDRDATRLHAAILAFQRAQELSNPDQQTDIRANLEIAKVLWARARSTSEKPPRAEDPAPEPERKNAKDDPPGDEKGPEGKQERKKSAATPADAKDAKLSDEKSPLTKAQFLPVVEDREAVQPLSADDTRALLRKAEERLRRDRIRARQGAAPADPRPNDW